jgi:class 3 adenylate cyclase
VKLAKVDQMLARWIRVGRTPDLKPSEARYVVLTNIVALLAIVNTVGFGFVLLVTRTWLYPALQVVYALGYVPVLWLNHRRHHVAATTWFLLGGQLLVAAQLVAAGLGYDVYLFFMLHAALPFMLYAPRHDRAMFALSMLAGADLVIAIALGQSFPQLGPVIASDKLDVIRPILVGGLFVTLAACGYYSRRATLIAEDALDRAHARVDELLLNILPPSIASRLIGKGGTIADGFGEVTVLFADLVGFTKLSARMPPDRVVEILNELFCKFDDLAGHLGLEKIKTIGDCYMVAGGLPEPRTDHAEAIAEMGLEMLRVVREFSARVGEDVSMRIGINSGPVVAGVIGKRKFIYDLWGDTVNTASRMESHGVPNAIQLSETSHQLLASKYRTSSRGEIEVKGKGPMPTWLLDGRR